MKVSKYTEGICLVYNVLPCMLEPYNACIKYKSKQDIYRRYYSNYNTNKLHVV